jgi:hypothetical protein
MSEYRPGMIVYGDDPPVILEKGKMSLRDYYAARAMQSIVTHKTYEFSKSSYEITAKAAYAIADAMLKARKNETEPQ